MQQISAGHYCSNLLQETKMSENIMKMLKAYFPSMERLSYDEYISDEIIRLWEWDEELIRQSYELISHPWPEISWPDVENIGKYNGLVDGCVITSFLNERSFIHVFPSLLFAITKRYSGLLTEHFIDYHLNLNNVYKDWELEFYNSLSKDVVKLVNSILKESDAVWAKHAIDSYWH